MFCLGLTQQSRIGSKDGASREEIRYGGQRNSFDHRVLLKKFEGLRYCRVVTITMNWQPEALAIR